MLELAELGYRALNVRDVIAYLPTFFSHTDPEANVTVKLHIAPSVQRKFNWHYVTPVEDKNNPHIQLNGRSDYQFNYSLSSISSVPKKEVAALFSNAFHQNALGEVGLEEEGGSMIWYANDATDKDYMALAALTVRSGLPKLGEHVHPNLVLDELRDPEQLSDLFTAYVFGVYAKLMDIGQKEQAAALFKTFNPPRWGQENQISPFNLLMYLKTQEKPYLALSFAPVLP